MGDYPCSGLAAIGQSPTLRPIACAALALAQNLPNPARAMTSVRFALLAAAPVSLAIYDIQGRRVATLLDHELQQAGAHDVPVHVGGWRPGVYLYRLEAGGTSATRKMLVVR
jgi:hypothetical protein